MTKISIVPRGMGALGYTLQLPSEDRFLMSESELLNMIDVLLGGRAAEEIIFGEISTGAANDISRASDVVRQMITDYGMSEKYRNIALPSGNTGQPNYLGLGKGLREYSEATQQYIDDETARIVNNEYQKMLELLKKNKHLLEKIARILLDKEVVEGEEFKQLIEEEQGEKLST